jgi:alkylated DNA repair dioxygenase AlkB
VFDVIHFVIFIMEKFLSQPLEPKPLSVLTSSVYVTRWANIQDREEWLKKAHLEPLIPREQITAPVPFTGDRVVIKRTKQLYADFKADGSFPYYEWDPSLDIIKPKPFPEWMNLIRRRIFEEYKEWCNHAILTYYKDGDDRIGAHHDKTHTFVPNSNIYLVSLGGPRCMLIKYDQYAPKYDSTLPSQPPHPTSVRLSLEHGSLLVMSWLDNKLYKHSIPKRGSANPRFSIVFRNIRTVQK